MTKDNKSKPKFKPCVLCDKFNTHIWYDICFICWLKIEEKTGFTPKEVPLVYKVGRK